MTELVYLDQSADALQLNLVQGAVDKDSLTVLCTGWLGAYDERIEAGILGASHYLEVSVDGQVVLTEVFACVAGVQSEAPLLFRGDLQDASSIRKHVPTMQYDFRARKLNWKRAEREFDRLVNNARNAHQRHRLGLVYAFPEQEGISYPFPPLTAVYCCLDQKTLAVNVQTIHAYPNEDALVFTETILNRR
jgi:hypothetical protein